MSEEFAAGYDKGYTEGFAQAALEAERLRAALDELEPAFLEAVGLLARTAPGAAAMFGPLEVEIEKRALAGTEAEAK